MLLVRHAWIWTLGLALAAQPASATVGAGTTEQALPPGERELPIPPARRVNVTSKRTVELLGNALPVVTGMSRALIIRDLGACEMPEAVPYLRAALEDADPVVRAEAVRSLAQLADRATADSLLKMLSDPSPLVRRELALAGASIGEARIVDTCLEDVDSSVKIVAISAANVPAAWQLIASKLPQMDAASQFSAVKCLARPEASRHAAAILPLIQASVPLKCAAIEALAAMDAPAHSKAFIDAMGDASPAVRRRAVIALADVSIDSTLQAVVLPMLGDPDVTVRTAAASLLTKSPAPSAIPLLVRQLDTDYPPLRDATREALAAAGPEAASVAVALLGHADPRHREDGSCVLGLMKSDAGIDLHTTLVRDPDPGVAAQAAKSLGAIGQRSAGRAIADVVAQIERIVERVPQREHAAAFAAAREAVIAAGRLGEQDALAVCKAVVAQKRTYPEELRGACLYACGLLGEAPDRPFWSSVLSIYEDSEETRSVKLEALKALGHARFTPAAARLGQIGQSESDPALRWIAHWAHDRIRGITTPYEPPSVPYVADVTIGDLPDAGGQPQLSVVLHHGPAVVPGSWTPLRVEFSNGSGQSISGYALLPVRSDACSVDFKLAASVPPHSRVSQVGYAFFPQVSETQRDRPLLIADWIAEGEQRIARAELVGRSIASFREPDETAGSGEDALLLCITDGDEPGSDPSALAATWGAEAGCTFHSTTIGNDQAPRHVAGYAGYRIVLYQSGNPDGLDISQRQALLEYLRGGGVLIWSPPFTVGRDPNASWLAAYSPVLLIGRSLSRQVAAREGGDPIAMTRLAYVNEAIERGGNERVMLGDGQFVHAAIAPLGLGRVVFTSFPPDALPVGEESNALWSALLGLDAPRIGSDWQSPEMLARHIAACSAMVGATAPAWRGAAAVAITYFAVCLFAQAALRGPRRPYAFAASSGVATVLAVVVLAISSVGQRSQTMLGARLARLIAAPLGGGLQQEVHAYVGKDDPDSSLRPVAPEATLRPLAGPGAEPPELDMLSFVARRTTVKQGEFQSVWSASRVLGADRAIEAKAAFGPGGLEISVRNGLGASLGSPSIVWHDAFPVADLPPGVSTVVPSARNRPGDYLNAGAMATEVQKLRARIIAGMLAGPHPAGASRRADAPLLIAWLDEQTLPSLIAPSADSILRTQALLQCPIIVQPAVVGSQVRIDEPFTCISLKAAPSLPYDRNTNQWVASSQPGEWLIGFSAPGEVGALRPKRVTLSADVSAPQHSITLIRGQCSGGNPAAERGGPVVARWRQPLTLQTAEFQCAPEDYDADGTIWILLQAENTMADPPDGGAAAWRFRRLELGMDAEVVSPAPAKRPGATGR